MGSGLRPMIIMSSTSISRSQPAFTLQTQAGTHEGEVSVLRGFIFQPRLIENGIWDFILKCQHFSPIEEHTFVYLLNQLTFSLIS